MRLGWEVGADLEQWATETWGLGFHSRGVGGDAWGALLGPSREDDGRDGKTGEAGAGGMVRG